MFDGWYGVMDAYLNGNRMWLIVFVHVAYMCNRSIIHVVTLLLTKRKLTIIVVDTFVGNADHISLGIETYRYEKVRKYIEICLGA